MRLLQSLLPCLKPTKKPPWKFVMHLLGLMRMLPGHATFRHLRRYSPSHERTFARGYDSDFDRSALHKAAITAVVPSEHEQALVTDASVVPERGKHTYGLARVWNGSPSRAEKGLAISPLAGLDITDTCAYRLRVEQTPPRASTSEPEATRRDVYCDRLSRVVQAHDLRFLRYGVPDGAYSKPPFVAGVRGLGLHQMGEWRADAHRRYRSPGPKHPGPGRQKTYDGKVNWSDCSRVKRLETEDTPGVLSHPVLHHVPLPRHLQVVVVVPTPYNRSAGLCSTDVALTALRRSRSYKARVQSAFLFRDAQPWAGLSDGHARSQAERDWHGTAGLSAVTFATLEARHHHGHRAQAFSMASLKRRAFNQHVIERSGAH